MRKEVHSERIKYELLEVTHPGTGYQDRLQTTEHGMGVWADDSVSVRDYCTGVEFGSCEH